ncbi:MAG: C25 family cysteine peptidase [Ignavibacteriae bacterium]|nr:C25 family cysteine peptidase [Ignavibacteriota bacterium]
MGQSNSYLNSYILVPPLSMNATKIFLSDTSGLVTFNYSDSIKNSINNGALLVSYIGHSGNYYWDYAFSNPNVLSNTNKYPLIFSMTCFTGKNAETGARGFGEQYLLLPNKGAIGFVSTTGWSFFPGGGNIFEQYFLNGFSTDSLRRLGDLMKFASTTMAPESLYFAQRNTINCYNLLGDPALKLALPKYPEFDIQPSDYTLSNPYPVVRENVSLKIYPKNYGTYADSCKIRFQLLRNNQNHSIKDTIVHSWGFIDTVVYTFKLDTVGMYSMKVVLDVDNWYPLESSTNNTIIFPFNLKNAAFVPIKPIDDMIIKSDTVEFVGINPNINTTTNTVKLLVQMDSSRTFNSALSQTYFNNNMVGAATKFKVRIPILDSNIIYYWRLNAIVNNVDTLGWSEIRRFNYNITLPTASTKTNRSINLSDTDYPLLPGDSNITIYKNRRGHFSYFELSYVNGDNSGLKIVDISGNLIASSWQGDAWAPTYYAVNNKYVYLIRSQIDWSGLVIVKVNKINGSIIDSKHIYMSSSASSDSVLTFLNTFDATQILMAVKLIPTALTTNNLNANAKSKFNQLGSTKIDSVDFLGWNRWSFISNPNTPSPITSEGYDNTSDIPVTSTMQPTFKFLNGNIIHTIGPAKTWKNFSWQQILYSGTSIKFDVYGIDRYNYENLLLSNIATNSFVDLQSINAYTYPYLKLVTKLNIDSITGSQSPVFQSLKFNYVAPSELALDYNTFIKSDSLLNGGDSLGISLAYYNVGYVDLYGYTRDIYTFTNTGQKVVLKSDVISSTLKIDSAHFVKTNVKLTGLPFIRKYNNYIPLYFEVTPNIPQNDLYTYNNITTTNVVVKGTAQTYTAELYSDGMKVNGGEFVRSKPDVEIKLKDKVLNNINSFDTSDFKLFINNIYQPYSSRTTNGLRIEGIDGRSGNILLKFNPLLPNGENIFKLVSRKGAEGNYDTTQYSVFVSNQLMIKDFYNYPNPMKNQTVFIFNLGGNNPPSICRIKIYTVSGRVVKIINSSANIGYNQINWDGRDNEGDYMANGVYFYRMIIEGDTKIESPIQKLAILK